MEFKISYAEGFDADVEAIVEARLQEDPREAIAFMEHLDKSIARIVEDPSVNRPCTLPCYSDKGLRRELVEDYWLMYRVVHNQITIFGLVPGSTDIDLLG